MSQTRRFEVKGKNFDLVCKMERGLYGLKEDPRQWYRKFDAFMTEICFKKCSSDFCCYRRKSSDVYVILVIYVDDIFLPTSSMTR